MNDPDLLQRPGIVVLANVFTPKPGQIDAFCAAQIAEYRRLAGQVDGALGNRLLRAQDGSKAVNVAYFASRAQYDAWQQSDLFRDHLPKIKPLLDAVEPAIYEVAFESE